MCKTLEIFARENDLYLQFTRTDITITEFGRRNKDGSLRHKVKKQSKWEVGLFPPVMTRGLFLRDKQKGNYGTLWSAKGSTRREARDNFLRKIRGKIIEYYGIEFENDTKVQIKVPKKIR